MPDEVAAWAPEMAARGRALQAEWEERMEAYAAAHPAEAAEMRRRGAGRLPDGWRDAAPTFPAGEKIATRASAGKALNAFAAVIPELVQGAADLSTSTSTDLKDMGIVAKGDYSGRNIYFGVREHGMGAISNGLAAHGGLRPACATFFTFSDYMKNTIRLAALMKLPTIFVYTHDSVALGEDGPTHQPIEHLAALRAIPGLVTVRPADASEATAMWRIALERVEGPTAMVLSRQGLPTLPGSPAGRARRLRAGRRGRLRPHRHRRRGAHRAGRPRAAGGRRRLRPGGQHALHGALPAAGPRLPRGGAARPALTRAGLGGGGEPLRVGRVDRPDRRTRWRSTASASRRRATRRSRRSASRRRPSRPRRGPRSR